MALIRFEYLFDVCSTSNKVHRLGRLGNNAVCQGNSEYFDLPDVYKRQPFGFINYPRMAVRDDVLRNLALVFLHLFGKEIDREALLELSLIHI